MKAKVKTGGGMRGLVKYQIEKPEAEFVCGTQSNSKDFMREVAALRALRPDCKKPVLHISLSLPPGEKVSDETWDAIIGRFLEKMGLTDHAYFAVRHFDTDHDHVHIAACMIGYDGKRWDSQKSALRAQKVCTDLEVEFGLQRTRTLEDFRAETGLRRRPVSDGALRQFQRTGTLPSKTKAAIVKAAIARRKRREKLETADRNAHRAPGGGVGFLGKDRPYHQSATSVARRADRGLGNSASAPSAAHRDGGGYDGFLDKSLAGDTGSYYVAREADRNAGGHDKSPAQAHRAARAGAKPWFASQVEGHCWISGHAASTVSTAPHFLDGRLVARPAGEGVYDLYWRDRALPSFRYSEGEEGPRVELLAKPTMNSIAAMFDIAKEKFDPPYSLYGSEEFQRLAAEYARAHGIAVVPTDAEVAREHQVALEEMQHKHDLDRDGQRADNRRWFRPR